MRRAVLAILGTATGTTLLVGLKAQTDVATLPLAGEQAGRDPVAAGSGAPPAASPSAGAPTAGAPAPTSTGGGAATPPPGGGGGDTDNEIDGDRVNTPYGPVVVSIVWKNGRIEDVSALLPGSSSESLDRSARAEPRLYAQTLQRQSANVDTVSGATFTSNAYKRSLQSAIDKAKRGGR